MKTATRSRDSPCAASSSPAGDIHNAETSGSRASSAFASSAGIIISAFVSASAVVPLGVITAIAVRPSAGAPVRGSRISPKLPAVVANGSGFCCDVDIDMSRSSSVSLPDIFAAMRTAHPGCPGGVPIAPIELPPALIIADVMPSAFNRSSARSTA